MERIKVILRNKLVWLTIALLISVYAGVTNNITLFCVVFGLVLIFTIYNTIRGFINQYKEWKISENK
jgi:hypothetical protein